MGPLPDGYRGSKCLLLAPIAYGMILGASAVAHYVAFQYIPVALTTILLTTKAIFSLVLSKMCMGSKVALPKVHFRLTLYQYVVQFLLLFRFCSAFLS